MFNYTLKQIPNTTNFTLNFDYFDSISISTSYLNILINNTIEPPLTLDNQSLNILLNPYILCPDVDFFYIQNGACIEKIIFDYTWKYTDQYNVIEILFEQITEANYLQIGRLLVELNPIISDGISNGMFTVHSELLSLNNTFNYSFQIENGTVYLIFDFKDYVYSGMNVILKYNETNFMEVNDSQKILLVKKQLSIFLMDHSSSQTQSNLMDVTKNISTMGEIAVTSLIYVSYFLSPKSSFAIKGLLLLSLFQVLKFLQINYPENARIIFTSSVSNTFLKGPVTPIDEVDELLYGFPQLFAFYQASLLILNNLLDDYILIFIFVGICLMLFPWNCFGKCAFINKIVKFLSSFFVWNGLIMITFSKYINTVFFTLLSLRFSWGYSNLNSFMTFIYFLYVLILPLHIWKIIQIINKFDGPNNLSSPPPANNNFMIKNVDHPKSKFFPKQQENHDFIFNRVNRKVVPWFNFSEYATPSLKELSKKVFPEELTEKNTNNLYESPTTIKKSDLELMTETFSNSMKTFSSYNSQNKIIENNLKVMESSSQFNESQSTQNNKTAKISFLYCNLLRFLSWPYNYLYTVQNSQNYLKKFKILKKDFRDNMGLSRYYFVLDLMRYFIIPAIVPILFGFPLIQTTIIGFTSLLFFFFLVSEKPYLNKTNSIFSFINELCIIFVYLAAFSLSILDLCEYREITVRMNVGWIIVFSYLLLLASLLFNSFLRIFKGLFVLFKKLRILIS